MFVVPALALLLQSAAWPIAPYPGAELFPMGADAAVNGRPLSMYYFRLEGSLEDVLSFYRETWAQDGQVVSVIRPDDHTAALGYLDLGRRAAVNLILYQEGKLVFGFPAVMAEADRPAALSAPAPADLPVPPAAQGVTLYESRERGARFRTMSCAVREKTGRVEEFYLREMGRRGFVLRSRQVEPKAFAGTMLEFSEGSKNINVTISSEMAGEGTAVFLVANFPAPRRTEASP